MYNRDLDRGFWRITVNMMLSRLAVRLFGIYVKTWGWQHTVIRARTVRRSGRPTCSDQTCVHVGRTKRPAWRRPHGM